MSRPISVTAVGWIWCLLGFLMTSSAALALIVSQWEPLESSAGPPWSWLPILIPIQILMGVTGIVAGASFVRGRAWARPVLEVLTVLFLIGLVAVNIFVASVWVKSVGAEMGPFRYFGIVVAVFSTLLYGSGLVLMLLNLRSAEVRASFQR